MLVVRLVDGMGQSRVIVVDERARLYRVPVVIPFTRDECHGGPVPLPKVLTVDFAPSGEYDVDGLPLWRDTRTANQRVPVRYDTSEEREMD